MKTKEDIIQRMRHFSGLSIREAGEGEESRTITGYAILFNNISAPLWEDENEIAFEVISPIAITKEVLDACDIKMTMFHDRQLILARSRNGEGTLKYSVDEKGVAFEFEAPHTADGDKALELVRRGDISGCSFMFSTHYWDEAFVGRSVEIRDGKSVITYTVKAVTGIYDFTLAADPAYPDTTCEAEARELVNELRKPADPKVEVPKQDLQKMREQVAAMRDSAKHCIIH